MISYLISNKHIYFSIIWCSKVIPKMAPFDDLAINNLKWNSTYLDLSNSCWRPTSKNLLLPHLGFDWEKQNTLGYLPILTMLTITTILLRRKFGIDGNCTDASIVNFRAPATPLDPVGTWTADLSPCLSLRVLLLKSYKTPPVVVL